MILNQRNFNLSDLESPFLQRVKIWVENFTIRQILNQLFNYASDFEWIFYIVSDFERTSFAACQTFMRSSWQATFL